MMFVCSKRFICTVSLVAGMVGTIATSSIAAIAPVVLPQNNEVRWSQLVNDPFDGKIVFDRNFDAGETYRFVSSWSRQGIRGTYERFWSEIIGYQTVMSNRQVYRDGRYRTESYPTRQPIYRQHSETSHPAAILFSINGQVFTYEGGPVSPELAAALANAPAGNMRIRLRWANNSATDLDIGRGTVEAWRSIFGATSP